MRVLLIHRHYYPDSPPYALILENIRDMLVQNGYQVDVLTAQPSYKDHDKEKSFPWKSIINKSSIYRLPIIRTKYKIVEKILNYFFFPIQVFLFLILKKRYDLISVSTAPPITLSFLVALATTFKNNKLIYHCMDIHPEIGQFSGEFKNRYIFGFLRMMDNFTCKKADRIIVLSHDMKHSLLERKIPDIEKKIEIINNYDLQDIKNPTKSQAAINIDHWFSSEKRTIIYAGNLGRFQNLDIFVEALVKNQPLKNLQLIFLGEGTVLNRLKSLAQKSRTDIIFIPHQPIHIARALITHADMGIVSLDPNIIKYAYPSKVMTYLAEGTPILLSVDQKSEAFSFVEETKTGIAVKPGDLSSIYKIFKAVNDGQLTFDKEHIKHVFTKHFSKKIFDKKYLSLVKSLETKEIHDI